MARKRVRGKKETGFDWTSQAGVTRTNLPLFRNFDDRRFWAFTAQVCGYVVAKIARHLKVSNRQLQRHFEKHARCAPKEWVTTERMIAASQLLLQRFSIKEVAFDLRYRQVSHFCRDFKLFYHQTPLEYLAAMRDRVVLFRGPMSVLDNQSRVSAINEDCPPAVDKG
jgi:AraC-like DNA-binding protein